MNAKPQVGGKTMSVFLKSTWVGVSITVNQGRTQ